MRDERGGVGWRREDDLGEARRRVKEVGGRRKNKDGGGVQTKGHGVRMT